MTELDRICREEWGRLLSALIGAVSDLDSALTWAGKCPGITYGPIEVRPVMPIDM